MPTSRQLIWTGFVAVSKASKSYNGYVVPEQCIPTAFLYLQPFICSYPQLRCADRYGNHRRTSTAASRTSSIPVHQILSRGHDSGFTNKTSQTRERFSKTPYRKIVTTTTGSGLLQRHCLGRGFRRHRLTQNTHCESYSFVWHCSKDQLVGRKVEGSAQAYYSGKEGRDASRGWKLTA